MEVRARLHDVDRARGLAIILVVAGHVVGRNPPSDADWSIYLTELIYQFHMPFFMFLSGMMFFYRYRPNATTRDYLDDIRRSAARLLGPYFLFGAVMMLGKSLAAPVLHLDRPPPSLLTSLSAMVWDVRDGPVLFIWYLFVLFVFRAVCPPLLRLFGNRMWALMLVAAVLYAVPLPPYLYAERVGVFLPFFVLGGIVIRNYAAWTRIVDENRDAFVLLLLAELILVAMAWPSVEEANAPLRSPGLLIVGLSSLPALHSIVRSGPLMRSSILAWLGRNTLVIYLLNVIVLGAGRQILLQLGDWGGIQMLFVFPLLTTAGLLVPVLLSRSVRLLPGWGSHAVRRATP
jgi:fucose 4-O-acetylase-like acetyltransferase